VSDIFISYKSSDRERILTLVRALEQKGWSVWWDRTIPPGKIFDEVIEEALNGAKCVIVVWSKGSVISEWVKTEAAEGARRAILVPVLIDDVKIPLEFRRIQAASLVDWKGTLPHQGFDRLSEAIAGILGHSSTGVREQEAEGEKQETGQLEQGSQKREAQKKEDIVGTERKIQEEHPAFYQQRVEVTTNKAIPTSDQPKNWSKIIASAGVIALIVAAVITYRQVTKEVKVTVPSPKINYFKAVPEIVKRGESSTLSWKTSNAKEVEIDGLGTVELSGSRTIRPIETFTYTLIAINEEGKTAKQELQIEVKIPIPPPEILGFSANPSIIKEKGSTSVLTWKTSNAKEVEISNLGRVQLSDSKTVSPTETTTYTLTAKNEEGEEIKKDITVGVIIPPPPPEILDFRADLSTNGRFLIWKASNAEEVTLNGEKVKTSGSRPIGPTETTTYTLTAKNGKGDEVKKEVTVEVKAAIPSPGIIGFSAKPQTIKRGEISTLRWKTSNAKGVFLNKQTVEKSGSQDISPEKTTTYTLIAKNEEGATVERKVTVQVDIPLPPPKIDLKTVPETTKKGAEEQETKNPIMAQYPERYIKIIDRSIYVAWNGATIIHHVIIENTSDIAYKNIKVRVSYYSDSGTMISGQTGVLPVTVPPHSKKTYLAGGIVLGMGSSGMRAGDIEVLGAIPLVGE
jgi:hypothetical protein